MSKKLLLADDSVVIQKLVGLSFANEDIEIVATDNGDDAVSVARECQPDIILADVVMPGKSGYEVCEAIKQDAALAHVPVLLLTGTFEAFDENRASAAGADGQITKPFEAQALVERVTEVMNAPVAAPPAAASSDAPESGETIVSTDSSPAPASSDLFGENLGTLSGNRTDDLLVTDELSVEDDLALDAELSLDAEDARDGHDVTPAIGFDDPALDVPPGVSPNLAAGDPNAATVAPLFGGAGEKSPESLDDFTATAGEMALGTPVEDQTVVDASDSADRGLPPLSPPTASTPPPTLPPPTPPPALPPAVPQTTPTSTNRPVAGDPLADLSDRGALPPASVPLAHPVDLDVPLDDAQEARDAAPTFLAARDDVNATTSPNYDAQVSSESRRRSDEAAAVASPPVSDFDDLTVHTPTADIDSASHMAAAPTAVDTRAPAPVSANDSDRAAETVVANLDESLAVGMSSESARSKADDSRPGPDSDLLGPDNLDLGPASRNADDLDFAFDVSEQVAAENLADTGSSSAPSADSNGDSFSSLMDISESQILGGRTSEPDLLEPAMPPGKPPGTPPATTPAETIVAGYDVSSSDLATADPALAESAPKLPATPDPEPLYEIPELPRTHQPTPPPVPEASGPESAQRAATPDDHLFDDLATGSALEEITPLASFESGPALDSTEDLLEDAADFEDQPDEAEVASEAIAFAQEDEIPIDAPSLPAIEITEDPFDASADAGADQETADDSSDLVVGLMSSEDPADRAVPDMSPVMEQQIQETLEKVAWEAFSDLSESIVKQVMGRVEQIAWEVIPQMAETLVREEIRKMKGEDD